MVMAPRSSLEPWRNSSELRGLAPVPLNGSGVSEGRADTGVVMHQSVY